MNLRSTATCKACQLLQVREAGEAPLWDDIFRTDHWQVVHSYDSALEGWLVLVARRHIETIADLTEPESLELGRLIRLTSQALQPVAKCKKTYVVQFAEHPEHPHVHFHIIPRADDLPADRRGPGIFGYLGAPLAERITPERMNAIASKVRDYLRAALTAG